MKLCIKTFRQLILSIVFQILPAKTQQPHNQPNGQDCSPQHPCEHQIRFPRERRRLLNAGFNRRSNSRRDFSRQNITAAFRLCGSITAYPSFFCRLLSIGCDSRPVCFRQNRYFIPCRVRRRLRHRLELDADDLLRHVWNLGCDAHRRRVSVGRSNNLTKTSSHSA